MKFAKTVLSTVSAAALGLAALGLSAAPALASTQVTTSFTVTATVAATCAVSAGPMAFGSYSSLVATTSSSIVSVTCTTSTPYTLGLSAGATSGATVTTRQMKNGALADLLSYGLFTDSGHLTNFATLASANGTGAAVPITVYGQIPAGQYVTPSVGYTDSITATVTY
jgi:spore coat protein U-like protein